MKQPETNRRAGFGVEPPPKSPRGWGEATPPSDDPKQAQRLALNNFQKRLAAAQRPEQNQPRVEDTR